MAFGTCRKPPPLRFWGASRFRLRAGPDLRKHRPNAFTAPPERIGPEPDLLCRLLRLRAFGALPGPAPCGAAGPLFGRKKTTQPEGLCGEKNKTGKIHTDFPRYFITAGPFLSSVRPAKGSSQTARCCQGKPTQKEPICRNSPLFRPLFQKKFLLHAFRELPSAKGGGGPGKARPSKKPIFFEARA